MIQLRETRNAQVAVTTTSSQICNGISQYNYSRVQIVITNTDATGVVTITKGTNPAVSNIGIILQPNMSYIESTDSGFECWQGALQAISTKAQNISIVETFNSQGE